MTRRAGVWAGASLSYGGPVSETTKMTAAAYAQLEAEIADLEGEGRRDKAERIGVAREWGDLKENAEYHSAKNDAAMLEARIARLRDQLRSAEIVEEAGGAEGAGMGSTVTYADEDTGKEMEHKLVPEPEARPADGLISIDSPVGQALAGSHAEDVVTIETPRGKRKMRVVAVRHS